MVMLPEKVELMISFAVTVPDVKLMVAAVVDEPPVKAIAAPLPTLILPELLMLTVPEPELLTKIPRCPVPQLLEAARAKADGCSRIIVYAHISCAC